MSTRALTVCAIIAVAISGLCVAEWWITGVMAVVHTGR